MERDERPRCTKTREQEKQKEMQGRQPPLGNTPLTDDSIGNCLGRRFAYRAATGHSLRDQQPARPADARKMALGSRPGGVRWCGGEEGALRRTE